MSNGLLGGVRVLDFAWYFAVPFATRMLAHFGAEVIKIDTVKHWDTIRVFPGPRNIGASFPDAASGKKIVGLDTTTPEGKEIFQELIKITDIYVTNFGERTLRKAGGDYQTVSRTKQDIIMLWGTAWGLKGPYAGYNAYGPTFQAMCGQMDLCGLPSGQPTFSKEAFCDYHAPVFSCVYLIGALEHRRRTGRGILIETPLFESGAFLLGPAILDYCVNNRGISHIANRYPCATPHGVYRCKGDDRWCTITVFSEQEWQAFCTALGNPSWTNDVKFAGFLERKQNEDELDELVSKWTVNYTAEEVMNILQKYRVRAGIVYKGQDLVEDKHLKERGFYRETAYYAPPGVEATEEGTTPHPTIEMSVPIKFSDVHIPTRPVRRIGEDNDYVYGTLLKMSKQEIKRLTDSGVLT